MRKIASPQHLQAELAKLIKLCESDSPSRAKIASELRSLADRVAYGQDTYSRRLAKILGRGWRCDKEPYPEGTYTATYARNNANTGAWVKFLDFVDFVDKGEPSHVEATVMVEAPEEEYPGGDYDGYGDYYDGDGSAGFEVAWESHRAYKDENDIRKIAHLTAQMWAKYDR